jgi:hypothetical protein
MDILHVFCNNEDWKNKVLEKGICEQDLFDMVKDVSFILADLRNDEVEDFIFRLKIRFDKENGKESNPDDTYRTPMRISVALDGKNYFFRLCVEDKVFLRCKSRFVCESCGLGSTFKIKGMKAHVEKVHGG